MIDNRVQWFVLNTGSFEIVESCITSMVWKRINTSSRNISLALLHGCTRATIILTILLVVPAKTLIMSVFEDVGCAVALGTQRWLVTWVWVGGNAACLIALWRVYLFVSASGCGWRCGFRHSKVTCDRSLSLGKNRLSHSIVACLSVRTGGSVCL